MFNTKEDLTFHCETHKSTTTTAVEKTKTGRKDSSLSSGLVCELERKEQGTKSIRHQCNMCDKSFSLRQSLNLHMNMVHSEKPYRSEKCKEPLDSGFSSTSEATMETVRTNVLCGTRHLHSKKL